LFKPIKRDNELQAIVKAILPPSLQSTNLMSNTVSSQIKRKDRREVSARDTEKQASSVRKSCQMLPERLPAFGFHKVPKDLAGGLDIHF